MRKNFPIKFFILVTVCLFCALPLAPAIKLSELLTASPIGKTIKDWNPSPLVPNGLVGKMFTVPSEKTREWQLRFFTFEDYNNIL